MWRVIRFLMMVLVWVSCGQIEDLFAQSATTPYPPPINTTDPINYSSLYGSRLITGKYQFHQGVDYAYPLGTPIIAVQGGTIDKLENNGGAGWMLSISGSDSKRFSYLHLFDNSVTDPNENTPLGTLIIAANPTVPLLVNAPDSKVTLEFISYDPECYGIVFWADYLNKIPIKALAKTGCGGLPVGNSLYSVNSQVVVSQGDMIALVGHSGAQDIGPHLHLQLDGGKKNELLYVQHDNSDIPNYDIRIYKDKGDNPADLDASKVELQDGSVLDRFDSPLTIRTTVNYGDSDHDLDQVQIFMYPASVSPDPATDSTTLSAWIASCGNNLLPNGALYCLAKSYGGTGGQKTVPYLNCASDSCSTYWPLATAIQQGVWPQSVPGQPLDGQPGVVDFLTNPIDLTQLALGNYKILVVTQSILGPDHIKTKSITVLLSGMHINKVDRATGIGLSGNLSGWETRSNWDGDSCNNSSFPIKNLLQCQLPSSPPNYGVINGFLYWPYLVQQSGPAPENFSPLFNSNISSSLTQNYTSNGISSNLTANATASQTSQVSPSSIVFNGTTSLGITMTPVLVMNYYPFLQAGVWTGLTVNFTLTDGYSYSFSQGVPDVRLWQVVSSSWLTDPGCFHVMWFIDKSYLVFNHYNLVGQDTFTGPNATSGLLVPGTYELEIITICHAFNGYYGNLTSTNQETYPVELDLTPYVNP